MTVISAALTSVELRRKQAIQSDWCLPLPLEGFAFWEYLLLRFSPVFRGVGVPRGEGTPVVTVPGFLWGDEYMSSLRRFLIRIGYRAFPSGIGRNATCLDTLSDRLEETVLHIHEITGERVFFVAHSFGDPFARRVTQKHPELVAGRISLASPKNIVKAHPVILTAADFVRAKIRLMKESADKDCFTDECQCPTVRLMVESQPLQIPCAALYSKMDGVVDWRICREPDGQGQNIEVPSTHSGMAFNPVVFRRIAELLHEFSQTKERALA
ncbi:MAG: hypothetical protein A2Z11_04610 [Candidatus Woykebacteria bacterium RBG_16_43_9]|uniref:AB hydrolase-1 domain-containing protein n=1 Tax=Candidatus Woykebacteria bacterium RBG_16_43_9 TaxID=1802596 RepID=A0A1G1WDU3_9BACT|nr:MAG: hypothetical protein A2Z11_04610 [Candidatus Woykebacteria bacterium RBG_16_43_9]